MAREINADCFGARLAPSQELFAGANGEVIFGGSWIQGRGLGRLEPSYEPDEEAVPRGSEVRHKRRRSPDDDDSPSVSP